MDDLERQRRTRKLLLGGCLIGGLVAVPVTLMILPILAVVLGFALGKQHHDANKQHMQTPQVAQAVARELALYCQSVEAPISDHSTGDAWLPQVLRDCHPAYGELVMFPSTWKEPGSR